MARQVLLLVFLLLAFEYEAAAQLLSLLPRSDEFVRADDGQTVRINAVSIVLTQDLVDPAKHFELRADRVRVRGSIRLPGKNFLLVARTLENENGAAVDTSGGPPDTSFRPGDRATDGQNPGDAGTVGQSGSTGKPAGSITVAVRDTTGRLILRADGGPGGRGQDGGHGAKGGAGAVGANQGECDRDGDRGGNGLGGGDAGAAGSSGRGGDAGNIHVSVLSFRPDSVALSFALNFTPSVSAGNGGEPAVHGNPGEGGDPGAGGFGTSCSRECDSVGGRNDRTSCRTVRERTGPAPSGTRGPEGTRVATSTARGERGQRGTVHQQEITSAPGLLPLMDTDQLLMELRAAEHAYLTGDIRTAVQLFDWLANVSHSESANEEVRSIRQRCLVLLSQVSLGLDFFGRTPNYVPLVSLDFFDETVTPLLQIGERVETSYREYLTANQSQEIRLRELDAIISQSQMAEEVLANDITDAITAKQDIQSQITSLTEQRERLFQTIAPARERLERAIQARNSRGWGLSEVLKLGTAVAAFASGGFASVAAIGSAVNELGTPPASPEFTAQLDFVVKRIEIVGREAGSLVDNFNRVRDALPVEPGSPRLDDAKLIADEAQFEQTIAPFLDMPEAQEFRRIMRQWFDLNKVRNQRLLEYSSSVQKVAGLEAALKQQRAERTRVVSARAASNDPTLPVFQLYMARLYANLKNSLVAVLFDENRAFEYWSLQQRPFEIATHNMAQLGAFHGRLRVDLLNTLQAIGRDEQEFSGSGIRIRLTAADDPVGFTNFRSTGVLQFTVPSEIPDFVGKSRIIVTQVQISAPGIRTGDGSVRWRLTHSGKSQLFDLDGTRRDFSHLPRTTLVENDSSGLPLVEGTLGLREGLFEGISPFALWTLSIGQAANPGLNLANVNEVVLTFEGKFLPARDSVLSPVAVAGQATP